VKLTLIAKELGRLALLLANLPKIEYGLKLSLGLDSVKHALP
jgi:hypothetical protein